MFIICNHCHRSHQFPTKRVRSPSIIYCPYCSQDMRAPAKKKKRRWKRIAEV